MGTEDIEELKGIVTQTLESKGVLGKIKAELRASVFTAITDKEKNNGVYLENRSAKMLQELLEARIALGLVCEFLEYYEMDFTLSVLLPEANISDTNPAMSRELAAQHLKMTSRVSSTRPLLLDMVANTTGSASSSPSNHHDQHSPRSPRVYTSYPHTSNNAPLTSTSIPLSPTAATSSSVVPPLNIRPPTKPQVTTQPPPQPQQIQQPQPQQQTQKPKQQQQPPKKSAYPLSDEESVDDDDFEAELDDLKYRSAPPKSSAPPPSTLSKDAAEKPKPTPVSVPTPASASLSSLAGLPTLGRPATAASSKLTPLSTKPIEKDTSKDKPTSKVATNTTAAVGKAKEIPPRAVVVDDDDSDPESLKKDLERLKAIEQKLNLFNKPSSDKSVGAKPVPTLASDKGKSSRDADLESDIDEDIDLDAGSNLSGSDDYSRAFDDDDSDGIITNDQSVSERSLDSYDHSEDVDDF